MESTETIEESGLLGFSLHSNGEGYNNLNLKFQPKFIELENTQKTVADRGEYGKMYMNGAEVYKFAVNAVRYIYRDYIYVHIW